MGHNDKLSSRADQAPTPLFYNNQVYGTSLHHAVYSSALLYAPSLIGCALPLPIWKGETTLLILEWIGLDGADPLLQGYACQQLSPDSRLKPTGTEISYSDTT